MKKTAIVGLSSLLVAVLGLGLLYAQAPSPSTTSQPDPQVQQGWWCPWCGRWEGPGTMGPGMMGRGMWGSGGMGMHQGWGMRSPDRQPAQPLSLDQAKLLMENQLRSANNPNLKLGKLTEEKDHFLGEITTKDGSLVDRIQVDKITGGMRSAY